MDASPITRAIKNSVKNTAAATSHAILEIARSLSLIGRHGGIVLICATNNTKQRVAAGRSMWRGFSVVCPLHSG
jgi:hypothetical protein